jgi:hypothetical protein
MRRFGGDSTIVGKQVRLDGNPVAIIGVVQPAPFFPDRIDATAQHGDKRSPSERDDGGGAHASHD